MAIINTVINSIGSDIFTCPGSYPDDIQEHAVTCVIFCNVSSDNDVNLTLQAVPLLGTGGFKTTIIKNLNIPSGETFTFDTEKLVLSAGDRLLAFVQDSSKDDKLVCTVSSMRVS